MFGRRPDARPVENLSAMRRFMPYVSPRRNDSVFYMMQQIDVEAALEFLEKKNANRPPERRMTLFHLFLRSCSQALKLRPGVNRFVKGGRLWQREGEWLTFSAKRELRDGAPLITVKRRFYPDRESLDQMVDEIHAQLGRGRSGKKTTSDKEMALMLRLPGPAIQALLFLARLADRFGVLPKSMIEADPLYTSIFLANLGSIDYPAGFHHLWEYGTCSIFGVMGRIEQGPDGRRRMGVAWTYDERIEDGLYSYHGLEGIRERIENPELLEATTAELAARAQDVVR
jgi:pyruvate/2-oxoglutarate dehydrogenase complex dihydrolipoamide acyltransferase (E2) component